MNIFISYSGADVKLLKEISTQLSKNIQGIELLYWDKDKLPGEDDWASIHKWIDQSQIIIAIVTPAAIQRGISIGFEGGYAKKSNKVIIPFISKEIKIGDIGWMKGLIAIYFDETDPSKALSELYDAVQRQKSKIIDGETKGLILVGLTILYILSRSK